MSETVVAPTPAPAPYTPPPASKTDGWRANWRSHLFTGFVYLLAIAAALGISALIVSLTGGSPHKVFTALYDGSIKTWASVGNTLDYAAPLLIVAVGTIVAVRAGFFNIGQEGQVTIGAMCTAIVALKVHPAGWAVLVLALLAGAVGGALWAGICALLRFWRGVDVVISSLLLIFVAGQVLSYALSSQDLLQEHGSGDAILTESDQLSGKVQLPRIGEYPHLNYSSGLFIALGLTIVIAIFMTRTKWGFRIRMLGMNPVAAKRAGVRAAMLGSLAIMISGATAGLAGGVELTGQAYRITPTISNNIGWNGLLVALVARNNAWAAIGVALLFGALQAGGGFLSVTGVPIDLVNIVIALVVVAVVFPPALTEFRKYRRARAQASAAVADAPAEAVAA
jgi:simple sugar transport system permease protein